jgi:Flp pilus assembly protein TadG
MGSQDNPHLERLHAIPLRLRLRNRLQLAARHEDGQALLEMASVLPVLLLVVTGIFTFGMALNSYVTLTEATSVGARQLAISRQEVLDPCASAVSAITTAAPLLSPSNLGFTFVLNGTTYTGTTCLSSSTSSGSAANLVQGQPITVTVTYPCTLKVYKSNLAPSCTLTAKTTEICQ